MPQHVESSGRLPADCTQRHLFAWSLLAGLLLLGAMAGPFFARRVYTRDDLGGFHLPVRAFYAEQLARGEPFDWMPQMYAGFYLTGEGQGGAYHPWHLLLYRYLPLQAAMGWEWLSPYPLLLAGAWLFLRRKLVRRDAALLGSLLFTFCGFNLLHFVHPNAVAVVAHIPWLLWAIDIMLVDASRRKVAAAQAAVALLTGSELLLGYPQYVWFSLLAEAAYAGFLLRTRRLVPRDGCENCPSCSDCAGCNGSVWPRLVIAKGAGLLLGAVQVLPTLDALLHSTRQAADATALMLGSLHPLNLLQLVAPYFFVDRALGGNTHELSVYIGAAPLMLIVWLLVRRRELGALGPLAKAAGWFALLALLLAMGQYGQLYRLQQYLPLVGRFRCPCRYLVLFQLCAALLAAMGFLLLEREYVRQRAKAAPQSPGGKVLTPTATTRQFEPFAAVLLLSVATGVAGLLLQHRSLVASVPAVLASPLLMAAAAALVMAASRGLRGALVGLVLLAAGDLGYYGLSYAVYPQTCTLDEFIASSDPVPSAGETPAPQAAGRVFAPPVQRDGSVLWTGNQMLLAGWQRSDGYAGLEPRRQLDYYKLPALRAASVRWVQRDETTSGIEGLVPCGDEWLQVPNPLPHVRLLTEVVASRDPARDIERIAIDRAALCENSLALPPAAPGRATLVAERPGRIEIDVRCASPQLLVISESYDSGWRAAVDGRPREVFRVNGDFLGCLVAADDRRVVLDFQPGSLKRGRMASIAGACLILCCFLGGTIRRTPPPLGENVP
jgi:hypothetical protein